MKKDLSLFLRGSAILVEMLSHVVRDRTTIRSSNYKYHRSSLELKFMIRTYMFVRICILKMFKIWKSATKCQSSYMNRTGATIHFITLPF